MSNERKDSSYTSDGYESAHVGLHVDGIRHSIEESRTNGEVVLADKVFEALEACIKGMTRHTGRQ